MLIDIFLQTQCEIGMISDREMLYMIEQGLRGGLSFVNNRYVNHDYVRTVVRIQPNTIDLKVLFWHTLAGWGKLIALLVMD